MAELKNLLVFMDANDRARVIKRYEDMFNEAGEAGESALIRCFGSPVRQVLLIEQEYREAMDKGETPFLDTDRKPAPPAEEKLPEEPAPAVLPVEPLIPDIADRPVEILSPEPVDVQPELPEEPAEPEIVIQEDEPEIPELSAEPEHLAPEAETATMIWGEEAAEPAVEPVEESAPETCAAEETLPEPEILPQTKSPMESEEQTDILDQMGPELPLDLPDEKIAEKSAFWEGVLEEAPAAPIKSLPPTAAPEEEPPEDVETEADYARDDDDDAEPYEDEDEDEEDDDGPGGGRIFAAVLVTIPMLPLWALMISLSLVLGVAVLALGLGCGAAALYLASYVFSGVISFTPDLILIAGGALFAAAIALLLIWMGLWIAIGGCILTVRLSAGIYRGVLGKGKEE